MGAEYCPQCGTQRVGAFKYCAKCGFDFDAAPTALPPPASAVPAPPATPPSAPQSFSERYRSTPLDSRPAAPEVAPGPERRGVRPWAFALVAAFIIVGAIAAVVLSNAGKGSNSPAQEAGSFVVATLTPAPETVSSDCAKQVGPLVAALESLDSRLSIGMNFSDYSQRVGDAKVAYDQIDVSALDATCVSLVGVKAENALNEYITAYNTWNGCVSDINCTNDSITSTLQSHWANATVEIAAIKESMP